MDLGICGLRTGSVHGVSVGPRGEGPGVPVPHPDCVSAAPGMVQIVVSSGGTGALAQWVLVELQGEVEPRQSGDLTGSLLGDLHYTREVVQLEKPFAVLVKQGGAPEPSPAGPHGRYTVTALIKTKLLFKTRPKPIITHVPKKV
ncbi:chromosome transmission fidelity protein 8 homolog isoform X2 [Hirundo rustica]|uniref:chromosome transmission fidelity protein 8 homolog isoform X2 n=1 Tax=Hirundo rustica TaxID=43150 RepID=UPI0026716B10|nr:chromosome transmission fidelity protein 8 homolog isoform X2 [Hirundo rustica]